MARTTKISWIVLLVLLLSSCVTIGGKVDLREDGTSRGELTFTIPKQTASMAGISSADAWVAQLKGTDIKGGNATWSGSETENAYIGKLQGEFPENGMFWATVRQGDTQTVMFANTKTSSGTLDIEIHVDGYVQSIDGKNTTRLNDHAVRVSADLSKSWSETITVDLSRKPNSVGLVLALIGIPVLVGAGGLAFWRFRQKPVAAVSTSATPGWVGSGNGPAGRADDGD